MLKQQLGTSELFVSEIGLGCMSLKASNEKDAVEIIHKVINNGINFLDTADLYEFGMNEQMVGKAIKRKRDQVILASKVGNRWRENQEGWSWDPSKKYIKSAIKESLRRLETDYIDLYQLHGGTIEDPIDETIEAFEELTKEGLIRYYGISSIRPNVIKEFATKSNIVSVMMQYSILDRRPEVELFDFLNDHNISVIARGPLAKGVVSSNWRQKLGNGFLDYRKEELEKILPSIESVLENEQTMTSLALRYATAPQTVAATIPGARTMEQVTDILNAYDQYNSISQHQLEKVKVLTRAQNYTAHLT
ncbi:aldo/keto reductase [Alkalihalobacterium alkalinitrilicum]|uniref:aldo/keto reductase n=1 Tax=Alkalihalobacterium alkalinitrilicum TaxID=427920 RepID=UPI0009957148|nr:aldo/keto reductase [Alkalihalobacterium alkalinitrilicum]